MFSRIMYPIFPLFLLAPIIATLRGEKKISNDIDITLSR